LNKLSRKKRNIWKAQFNRAWWYF